MTDVMAPVSANALGKAGDTVKTPEVVRFTGAAITVWTEPAGPKAIRVAYQLSANGMLLRRFELDLMLADKAAWVVLVDASTQGVFTICADHTVTLLRFHWGGRVTVTAVVNGRVALTRSHDGVPPEVWDRVKASQERYCLSSHR